MTREDVMSEIEENIIKYMKKYPNHVGNADFWEGFYACRNVVLQLDNEYSPKEQEPCDDAISRNDMLDAVGHGTTYTSLEVQKIINGLPSVNPVPCDNAVSRRAVIDIIDDEWLCNAEYEFRPLVESIMQLPSVRPQEQTGKWVEIVKEHKCYARDDTYTTTEYHCSECGEEPFVNEDGFYEFGNYCPNCGAKMVEPQESEKKE